MTLTAEDVAVIHIAEADWRVGRSGIERLVDVIQEIVIRCDVPASPAIADLLTVARKSLPRDVRDIVDRVFRDFDIRPLSDDDAIRLVAAGIAARIVAGEVAPETGAEEIGRLPMLSNNEDRHLAIVTLADEWRDSYGRQDDQGMADLFRGDIVTAAQGLIERWKRQYPNLEM